MIITAIAKNGNIAGTVVIALTLNILQGEIIVTNKPQNQIWKLQRPLFASDGQYGNVLAYTENSDRTGLIVLTGQAINELFGDKPKIYVSGYMENENLVIDKIVEDQDW